MTLAGALAGAVLRSNEHNLTLLAALDIETLLLRPRPGARTVGEIFEHVHEVRVRRLEVHGGGDLLEDLDPLEEGEAESRDALAEALRASADRTATFLLRCVEAGKEIRGFASIPDFAASLIAHDAHHRGQVLAVLARAEVEVPDAIADGIWKWC